MEKDINCGKCNKSIFVVESGSSKFYKCPFDKQIYLENQKCKFNNKQEQKVQGLK